MSKSKKVKLSALVVGGEVKNECQIAFEAVLAEISTAGSFFTQQGLMYDVNSMGINHKGIHDEFSSSISDLVYSCEPAFEHAEPRDFATGHIRVKSKGIWRLLITTIIVLC